MKLSGMNEYGDLKAVAVRTPALSFVSAEKIEEEWQALRFYSAPNIEVATAEHAAFVEILRASGSEVIELNGADSLTLDAIYTRDALLASPKGLILCNMGRKGRNGEPFANAEQLVASGIEIIGEIKEPGCIEGGDIIWLNDTTLAVGEGPRTNAAGIAQLKNILGPSVEVHTVPLPAPAHPDDVFHLMSMISPLDVDLALIHKPLMPKSFLDWLAARGISFVDVAENEFEAMACNVLALGPRDLLMLDCLPETKSRLEEVGCRVQTYKGDEISRKGEGGPTCLTRPIARL